MSDQFEYHGFFPFIVKEGLVTECNMNARAYEFAQALLGVQGDRRTRMKCDSRLVTAAQKHAEYLAGRTTVAELSQSMHIGRDGSYPNERVRAEGYRLPGYYPDNMNNVESCGRNAGSAQETLDLLLGSPHHYAHLTGQDWFADHIIYGVGQYQDDWVVVIAPIE